MLDPYLRYQTRSQGLSLGHSKKPYERGCSRWPLWRAWTAFGRLISNSYDHKGVESRVKLSDKVCVCVFNPAVSPC